MPRNLVAPSNDVAAVLLVTGTLPEPMSDIARHPWFATRRARDTRWQLWEVGGGGETSNPFDNNGGNLDPILHGLWTGAQADRAIDCLQTYAPDLKASIEAHYLPWPGPNSNTFADVLLRRCKLSASLPATSVGKDYRGWIGAGSSSERTGVQLETAIVGIKVGLKEGIEVHFIGLSFGIDLWPPAIILPLGPGRIGFGDR
jgi:hypothetical protein